MFFYYTIKFFLVREDSLLLEDGSLSKVGTAATVNAWAGEQLSHAKRVGRVCLTACREATAEEVKSLSAN